MTPRVALYAVPGTGAGDPAGELLRQRAESWLGRAADGSPVAPAAPEGWRRDEVDAVTVDARRYGVHGTLKAPFRLAPGCTLEQLEDEVAALTAGRPAVSVPALTLTVLDGFFALVPGGPVPGLDALAAALVTDLDAHRAPPTDAETARRSAAPLSARQRELLAAWGYPYVLDEFRFHLTLTDRVAPEQRPRLEQALTSWFAGCLGRPVALDAVAVCTEAAPGAPFRLRSLHPLRRTPDLHPAPDHGRSR